MLETQIGNFGVLRTEDTHLSVIALVELNVRLIHATDEINPESRKKTLLLRPDIDVRVCIGLCRLCPVQL